MFTRDFFTAYRLPIPRGFALAKTPSLVRNSVELPRRGVTL